MANTPNAEIDLLDMLLKGVKIVRDNFWLILLFFIVGTGLGFVHYYSSVKVYESRMVLSSEILTESYAKQLVSSLNQFRNEGNLPALSKMLNMPEAALADISRISVSTPYANENEVGKEADRKYLVITAQVYNLDVLDDLQKSLITYFENNEYVKTRVEQKRKDFRELVAQSDQEIRDLENLKSKVYNGELFQNAKGGIVFDLTEINFKIIEITKEKLKAQDELALVNSIHVIDGFKRFEKPIRPNIQVNVIAGTSLGIFFVVALLAFKSIRRLLRMEEEARKSTT